MKIGRIFFLTLSAAAAITALVLLVYAHLDMAQMRTVRPDFNFDGLIAFLCGIFISSGLAVLFLIWRCVGYDPTKARRDLGIWIWVLSGLIATLHVPFAISFSIDVWINARGQQTPWTALIDYWLSGDGLLLLLVLLWPLPAIIGVWRYRRFVS